MRKRMKRICQSLSLVRTSGDLLDTFTAKSVRHHTRGGVATSLVVTGMLLGTLLLAATPAASEEKWAWFYAGSLINKWSIGQGQADVELSGATFSARLYEDGELAVTLRGTVKNGRIQATALLHRTDAPPAKLVGKHGRVRWKEGGAREAILLTEPDAPWGTTIGLTREVGNQ